MEFLIGNPFSTPVGQRIEYATSSSLPSEDWGLNMEICDIVNETEEGYVSSRVTMGLSAASLISTLLARFAVVEYFYIEHGFLGCSKFGICFYNL
uniref:VHS domain-containing protein n=1 Tax=Astyanax mexicanus TaxID=7994 RepID=A0A8B9GVS0_ASTMX